MPDSLTQQLLQRLGIKLPDAPAPVNPDLQNQVAQRAQAQDPAWKQYLNKGIDGTMEAFHGLTGLGDQGPAGHTITNGMGLLAAGIPFAGNTPLGKVFHGTGHNFTHFDVGEGGYGYLPQGIHFAERPIVANRFSRMKGDYERIIPAQLDIKNALDITQPLSPEDIEGLKRAIATTPPNIQPYGRGLKDSHAEELEKFLNNQHLSMDPSERTGQLSRVTLKDPDFLKRGGFDGVKYDYALNPGDIGWVADPHQAKTPWGVPLGLPPGVPVPKTPQPPASSASLMDGILTRLLGHPED
jgi:hypothetical protein